MTLEGAGFSEKFGGDRSRKNDRTLPGESDYEEEMV